MIDKALDSQPNERDCIVQQVMVGRLEATEELNERYGTRQFDLAVT